MPIKKRKPKVEKFCDYCPRKCKIDRNLKLGFCNENKNIRIAKIIDNFMWEEPCITKKNGVCAIFFSGCNLKCSYCQNFEISSGQVGKEYKVEEFINLLKEKEKSNSYFDFITPTHFSKTILSALKKYKPKIPIIWNSSGYEDVDVLKELNNHIDIYLLDFKYASDPLGQKYSNCKDYFSIAKKVISFCAENKEDVFDNEGYLKSGLIVRHLVIPGEIENSLNVLEFLGRNFKERIISIMSQFTPTKISPIKRKLKPLEYKIILKKLDECGFTNGYIQDYTSADESFIPNFTE